MPEIDDSILTELEREIALARREAELEQRESAVAAVEAELQRRERAVAQDAVALESQRSRLAEVREEYEERRRVLAERAQELDDERRSLRLALAEERQPGPVPPVDREAARTPSRAPASPPCTQVARPLLNRPLEAP